MTDTGRAWFPLALCLAVFEGSSAAALPPLEEAWREAALMNYDRAIAIFESHSGSATPASPAAREAAVGLAMTLQYRQPDRAPDKERARQIYDSLLEHIPEYPSEDRDRLILYLRARLAVDVDHPGDSPDPALAETLYRRLMHPDARDFYGELAASELALLHLKHGSTEQAMQLLGSRLKSDPGNPLAAAQSLLIGHTAFYLLGDRTTAMDAFRDALAAGIPIPTLPPAYVWGVARLAEQTGNHEIALEYYRRILKDFDSTLYADESRRAVRRLEGANNPAP